MNQFSQSAKISEKDSSKITPKYPNSIPNDTEYLLIKSLMNIVTELAQKGDSTAQYIIKEVFNEVAQHQLANNRGGIC